jgi:autotransporter-associated beta strand protein
MDALGLMVIILSLEWGRRPSSPRGQPLLPDTDPNPNDSNSMKNRLQSRLQAIQPAIKACFSMPALIVSAALSWSLSADAATETFNTEGTVSWVCPAGVTSIQVECWGGGGAGGSGRKSVTGTNTSQNGAGGGGGAYARRVAVPVTPGQSYTITIPPAAISGSNGTETQNGGAVNGGTVTFVGDSGVTVQAAGGSGGPNCYVTTNSTQGTTSGGAGGTVAGSIGDPGAIYAGGNGFRGTLGAINNQDNSSGGGGGGAGDTSVGGSAVTGGTGAPGGVAGGGAAGNGRIGANTNSGAGSPGAIPGGGGGGGKNVGQSTQLGGAGGLGQITITYAGPEVVKANNADHLNLTTSWVGGQVPASGNRAKWDATVTGANTVSLGSDLTFNGIVIANPAGPVTINPGNTLTLGAEVIDIDMSASTQDLTLNCDLVMGGPNVWDIASGRTLALGGAVSGSGLAIQGAGTALLQGTSTWTGNTTVGSGILKLGVAEGIPHGIGNGNVTINGTLDINGFNEQVNGFSGSGVVDNTAANTTSTLTVGVNNQAGTFSGSFQNTGSNAILAVTKTGTGALTLSGASSHSGLTTIDGGIVTIQNSSALGATTAGTVVNGTSTGNASNARLDLSGGITVTGEPITISGVGNFTGALSSASGFNEWTGNVTIGAALTRLGALAGATLKVSGVIDSGANPHGLVIRTTDLTGPVVLSGANTYLGDTWLAVGKLQLDGGNNRLPVATKMKLGAGTNITEFDLNGTNQELAGLAIEAGATAANNSLNNSSLTPSTLTVNTASPSSFGGIIKGDLALTKSGADTLTLTGANTHTGATNVTQGTLLLSTAGSGVSDISVSTGATVGVVVAATDGKFFNVGDLALGNNSVLSIDYGATNPSTTVAPVDVDDFTVGTGLGLVVKGTSLAGLVVGQSFPLVTWANNGPSDGSAFTALLNPRIAGTFSVVGKTLYLTVTANTAGSPISWNTGNGIWDTTTSNWVDPNLASTTFFDQFDAVLFGDAAGATGNPVITLNSPLSPSAVVMNSTARDYTLGGSGSIGGNASLTLDPANTRTLTVLNANTHTGATAVNGGTLALGNGGTDGALSAASPISIGSGATFSVNQSDTVTQGTDFGAAAITGAGNITQAGSGNTILTAANTYSGQTTVSSGTLQATVNTTGNGVGTSAVSIASGTTLLFDNTATSGSTAINNTITGDGLLKIRFAAGTTARNTTIPNVAGFLGTIQLSSPGANGDKWNATGIGTIAGPVIVDPGNTIYVSSGSTSFAGGISLSGAGNSEGRGAIRVGGATTILGGDFTLAGDSTISMENAAAQITGNISSGSAGTQTLTLGGTGSAGGILGGVIGGGSGTLNLATAVGGTYTLAGANTYTGTTTINAGILQLGNVAALGGNSPGVNASSSIIMAGGILRSNIDGVVVHSPITLSGGTAIINAPAVGSTGGTVYTLVLNGAISGDGNLNLVGVQGSNTFGTIRLGASSSYTGNTEFTTSTNNSTLFVVADVKNALPTTTVLNLNGGVGSGTGRTLRFDLNGFDQTLAGLTNVNGLNLRNQRITSLSGPATLTIHNSADFSFGGTVSGSTTTFSRLEGLVALTKNGAGTMTLTGASNTHSGATTVLGGILELGNTGSLQNSPLDTFVSVAGDANNGLRTNVTTLTLGGLSGDKNLASVFTTTFGGYDAVTALTLNPGTDVTLSYSGGIADGAAGTTLVKTGAGTQILAGANTYTGATSVGAGTLVVNGSIAASSAVSVSAGATLKGTGTVAGTVSADGMVAPGASTGTLTTGPATINGTLAIEIDGPIGDRLLSSGNIDLSGADLTVTLLAGGFTQPSYVIAEGTSITGTFTSVPEGYQVNIVSGGVGQQAILTSVGGYTTWAAANAGGQGPDLDFDNDGVANGVEFFMNAAAGFTANPVLNGSNTITWTNGGNIPASAYGTQFVVQTSPDLVNWTHVPVGELASNTDGPGGSLSYTLAGNAPRFVRLMVMPE